MKNPQFIINSGIELSPEMKDYIKFFTNKEKIDMLGYAYKASSSDYDIMLDHCEAYYPFRDESKIINESQNYLKSILADVLDIIEIGPGSDSALTNKTLPILDSAANLKTYHALDISDNYLEKIKEIILSKRPNLNFNSILADLTSPDPINLNTNSKKCVISLGITLFNFEFEERSKIIKKLYDMLDDGDILITTADLNNDEISLLKAYDNREVHNFIKSILIYFKDIFPEFADHIDSFKVKVTWDNQKRDLDFYIVSTKDITLNIPGYGILNIYKDQEFWAAKSHKPTFENVTKSLEQNKFAIAKIINYSTKNNLFVCKQQSHGISKTANIKG